MVFFMKDVMSLAVDAEVPKTMSLAKDKVAKKTFMTTEEFLNSTEKMRVDWENGAYVQANKQLYAVLARCYAFLSQAEGEGSIKMGNVLEKFYKERRYVYRRSTPLACRIVRAVFGNVDRRRISTYAIVIRQAINKRVEIADFADWIEMNGGVQEVRLGRSDTYVSKKDKAETVADKWDTLSTLCVADDKSLRMAKDEEFDNKHCLLIAKQNKDGTYTIKGVCHTNGIVEQAMATLISAENGADRKAAKEKAAEEKAAANDAKIKEAA
jgi:hypothetical protein